MRKIQFKKKNVIIKSKQKLENHIKLLNSQLSNSIQIQVKLFKNIVVNI